MSLLKKETLVYSLCFSPDSYLMAVRTVTETIHVYSLERAMKYIKDKGFIKEKEEKNDIKIKERKH